MRYVVQGFLGLCWLAVAVTVKEDRTQSLEHEHVDSVAADDAVSAAVSESASQQRRKQRRQLQLAEITDATVETGREDGSQKRQWSYVRLDGAGSDHWPGPRVAAHESSYAVFSQTDMPLALDEAIWFQSPAPFWSKDDYFSYFTITCRQPCAAYVLAGGVDGTHYDLMASSSKSSDWFLQGYTVSTNDTANTPFKVYKKIMGYSCSTAKPCVDTLHFSDSVCSSSLTAGGFQGGPGCNFWGGFAIQSLNLDDNQVSAYVWEYGPTSSGLVEAPTKVRAFFRREQSPLQEGNDDVDGVQQAEEDPVWPVWEETLRNTPSKVQISPTRLGNNTPFSKVGSQRRIVGLPDSLLDTAVAYLPSVAKPKITGIFIMMAVPSKILLLTPKSNPQPMNIRHRWGTDCDGNAFMGEAGDGKRFLNESSWEIADGNITVLEGDEHVDDYLALQIDTLEGCTNAKQCSALLGFASPQHFTGLVAVVPRVNGGCEKR